ncbi:hypothetical protein AB7M49_006089 [Bradyrhizobium elkanii]
MAERDDTPVGLSLALQWMASATLVQLRETVLDPAMLALFVGLNESEAERLLTMLYGDRL